MYFNLKKLKTECFRILEWIHKRWLSPKMLVYVLRGKPIARFSLFTKKVKLGTPQGVDQHLDVSQSLWFDSQVWKTRVFFICHPKQEKVHNTEKKIFRPTLGMPAPKSWSNHKNVLHRISEKIQLLWTKESLQWHECFSTFSRLQSTYN